MNALTSARELTRPEKIRRLAEEAAGIAIDESDPADRDPDRMASDEPGPWAFDYLAEMLGKITPAERTAYCSDYRATIQEVLSQET